MVGLFHLRSIPSRYHISEEWPQREHVPGCVRIAPPLDLILHLMIPFASRLQLDFRQFSFFQIMVLSFERDGAVFPCQLGVFYRPHTSLQPSFSLFSFQCSQLSRRRQHIQVRIFVYSRHTSIKTVKIHTYGVSSHLV